MIVYGRFRPSGHGDEPGGTHTHRMVQCVSKPLAILLSPVHQENDLMCNKNPSYHPKVLTGELI